MFVFPIPATDSPMIDFLLPGTQILILRVPLDAIIPVMIMILVFFTFGIFLQLAGVLTSRIFIDAIPNRVRNGVYSLFPTVVLLLSIPQIAFFGWLISVAPIPYTLILVGLISAVGCVMIQKAFQYPHPTEEQEEDEVEDETIDYSDEIDTDEWLSDI